MSVAYRNPAASGTRSYARDVKGIRAPRVGFFALVRLNRGQRIGLLGRQSSPLRGLWECLFHDRTGSYRAEPAVYFRRARAASVDYRTAGGAAYPDRHFSGYPDSPDR